MDMILDTLAEYSPPSTIEPDLNNQWMVRWLNERGPTPYELNLLLGRFKMNVLPNDGTEFKENFFKGALYFGGFPDSPMYPEVDAYEALVVEDFLWSVPENAPTFFLTREGDRTKPMWYLNTEKSCAVQDEGVTYTLHKTSQKLPKGTRMGCIGLQRFLGLNKSSKNAFRKNHHSSGQGIWVIAPGDASESIGFNVPKEKVDLVHRFFDENDVCFEDLTEPAYSHSGKVLGRENFSVIRKACGIGGRIYRLSVSEFVGLLEKAAPDVLKSELKKIGHPSGLNVSSTGGRRFSVLWDGEEISDFFYEVGPHLDATLEGRAIDLTLSAVYRMHEFVGWYRQAFASREPYYGDQVTKVPTRQVKTMKPQATELDTESVFRSSFSSYSSESLGKYHELLHAMRSFDQHVVGNFAELLNRGRLRFTPPKIGGHDSAPTFVHDYHSKLKNTFSFPGAIDVRSKKTSTERNVVQINLPNGKARKGIVKSLRKSVAKMRSYEKSMSYLDTQDLERFSADLYAVVYGGETGGSLFDGESVLPEVRYIMVDFAKVFPLTDAEHGKVREKTRKVVRQYAGRGWKSG